jgi:cysteinyl-tRNA synthetase
MGNLVLYNTKTRQKQILKKKNPFTIYTCGPTVYARAHIGNFRTFVCEDLMRRTLKFLGYKVKQVMNLTDVDDKTIKGAVESQCSLKEYTTPFIEAFFQDLKELGIEPVEFYPKATDYIKQMIQIIEVLIKKKHAYKTEDGNVYFNIESFEHYGHLSHLKLHELKVNASKRLAQDEYDREHVSDFILWKAHDLQRDGSIYWSSPFGKGRPGWHLECSCMAMDILGKTIELHAGGVDNIFPHHENEIAQSQCYSNKPFANYWMHVEHLVVDGKKMSKSLGNFYTLEDLLNKGYRGGQIRYLLLSAHYKTPLNFTLEALDASKQALYRLNTTYKRLKKITKKETKVASMDFVESTIEEFTDALSDDLNISKALSHLFDFVRKVNQLIDQDQIDKARAKQLVQTFEHLNTPLNLLEKTTGIPEEIKRLAKKRQEARQAKDFTLADLIRKEVEDKGYLIKDTPNGFDLTLF